MKKLVRKLSALTLSLVMLFAAMPIAFASEYTNDDAPADSQGYFTQRATASGSITKTVADHYTITYPANSAQLTPASNNGTTSNLTGNLFSTSARLNIENLNSGNRVRISLRGLSNVNSNNHTAELGDVGTVNCTATIGDNNYTIPINISDASKTFTQTDEDINFTYTINSTVFDNLPTCSNVSFTGYFILIASIEESE